MCSIVSVEVLQNVYNDDISVFKLKRYSLIGNMLLNIWNWNHWRRFKFVTFKGVSNLYYYSTLQICINFQGKINVHLRQENSNERNENKIMRWNTVGMLQQILIFTMGNLAN